jgi:hypothetical protein
MMSASWIARCSLAVALTLVGASASAAAQAQTVASRPSHAAQLKNALRSVAAAQTKYHAAKKAYAPTLELLRVPAAPGVKVEILTAGRSGWQARALHQEQPGRSCVIFVGRVEGREGPRTDEDREMAGEEGVPLCDRMR